MGVHTANTTAMILTRKIEIFINEDDSELRAKYYYELRGICIAAAQAANLLITHMFIQDNSIPYLSEKDRKKLTFLGTEKKYSGKRNKILRSSSPCVAASIAFKGKLPSTITNGLFQSVRLQYAEWKRRGTMNTSLMSFNSGLPVPIPPALIKNLAFHESDTPELKQYEYCTFSLFGMPFEMKFGRDRSNNKAVVMDVISGIRKMHTSALTLSWNKKAYLLLRVDAPQKQYQPVVGAELHCYLGVYAPIKCGVDADINSVSDKGYVLWNIGTMDDILSRRAALYAARRRVQKSVIFANGGRGYKKKSAAIEKWEKVIKGFYSSRMHAYSRMLVDIAVQHRCETIRLWNGTPPDAGGDRGDERLIRSWSFYGLKRLIKYKAKMYGIKVEQVAG